MTRTRGIYGWGVPTEIACLGPLRLVRPFFFTTAFYTQAYQAFLPSLAEPQIATPTTFALDRLSWVFGLRIDSINGCLASASASGRRQRSRSGGQATHPQGCPQACPVGRWLVHGGRVHHYIPARSPSNVNGSIPVSKGGSESVSAKAQFP